MAKKNEKFEVLYQTNDISSKNYMLIFKFNERKFRIRIEHSNGAPCGFNYKCCLAIMIPDGTFSNLVDNRDLGINWENQYVLTHIEAQNNLRAETAFKNYVEKVYGA